jgi:hypothetical protein
MIRLMVGLMRMGVHVAIVTAAGYPVRTRGGPEAQRGRAGWG